jgi:hypothetical protein
LWFATNNGFDVVGKGFEFFYGFAHTDVVSFSVDIGF